MIEEWLSPERTHAHTHQYQTIPHIALRELRETAKARTSLMKSSPVGSEMATTHRSQGSVKVIETATIFPEGRNRH